MSNVNPCPFCGEVGTLHVTDYHAMEKELNEALERLESLEWLYEVDSYYPDPLGSITTDGREELHIIWLQAQSAVRSQMNMPSNVRPSGKQNACRCSGCSHE